MSTGQQISMTQKTTCLQSAITYPSPPSLGVEIDIFKSRTSGKGKAPSFRQWLLFFLFFLFFKSVSFKVYVFAFFTFSDLPEVVNVNSAPPLKE